MGRATVPATAIELVRRRKWGVRARERRASARFCVHDYGRGES